VEAQGVLCRRGSALTSRYPVDLVLNEEVDQWHQSAKEGARDVFPVFDGLGVGRAQRNTTGCPRNGEDDVGNHQNIVPVMVVGRSDVCPSSTGQGANNPGKRDGFREDTTGLRGEEIPQSDKGESRTLNALATIASIGQG